MFPTRNIPRLRDLCQPAKWFYKQQIFVTGSVYIVYIVTPTPIAQRATFVCESNSPTWNAGLFCAAAVSRSWLQGRRGWASETKAQLMRREMLWRAQSCSSALLCQQLNAGVPRQRTACMGAASAPCESLYRVRQHGAEPSSRKASGRSAGEYGDLGPRGPKAR